MFNAFTGFHESVRIKCNRDFEPTIYNGMEVSDGHRALRSRSAHACIGEFRSPDWGSAANCLSFAVR